MKYLISFLLLSALRLPAGSAQEAQPPFQRLTVLLGGQETRLLDRQFSPVIHSAREASVRIGYEARRGQSHWEASLDVSTGSLYPRQWPNRHVYHVERDASGVETLDSMWIRGRTRTAIIQVGYARDVLSSGAGSIRLGLAARNQLMYPSSFTQMGILNAASLLVTLEGAWTPGRRHTLHAGFRTPVIGYNTRFPYSGTVSRPNQTLLEAFFDGGTRLVSLGTYQQVQAFAGWRYALSPGLGLGLRYDFMWQRYTHPVLLKSYANRIGVALDFKL